MSAYAALVSLINTIDQIQSHPRLSTTLDNKQSESLRDKVNFLLDFIENHSHGGSEEAQVLESQIASAAHAAEDVIEWHVVDQIHTGSISLLDLHTVIQGIVSVKENVVNIKEESGFKNPQPTYSRPAPNSTILLTGAGKSKMVGFEEDLLQLMERLTGQHSNREIIPIVGMGGSGKTTLATNLYENSLILQHFDIRAWVTISQEYNMKEIFSKLLSCQSKSSDETEDELAQKLYQSLVGRRYLIILDDMWSIEVWDKIKFFFPDNNNRSRVVVTTRLSDMAIHFGSPCHAVSFLDENKSWELFCEKTFPQKVFPRELEKFGKRIVEKCKGLPLLIVVVGGLLSKSSSTQEYWKYISEYLNRILSSGENEQSLDILSLSYNHLPAHLKPCFLYMGIFPENKEIPVSQLIKLWVAEGFLKPYRTQSLEETGECYLKDLVDRNLILESSKRWNGKLKTCRIHDLLRDLCLKTAEKENFLCVISVGDIPQGVDEGRRIVFHERISKDDYDPGVFDALESAASVTRSLLCNEGDMPFKFKLLRVMNMVGIDSSLDNTFKQVNLRYVWSSSKSLSLEEYLPSAWNLQMLIITCTDKFDAPPEIWEMVQLRHVQFGCLLLPDPPLSDHQDSNFVLRNLQTLEEVYNFRLSDNVCKRISSVKKLKITYVDFWTSFSEYCFYNLGRLHKLESLALKFLLSPNRDDLLQNLKFPSSLQKLSLSNCNLEWEDLTMIGSLPLLEFLKLSDNAVIGSEWNPVEGEFLGLKYLKISKCDELRYWNADSCHFPVLENLVLRRLSKLDEIPLSVGDISTLGVIDLKYCSESAGISTMRILEEQESLGNEEFRVRIKFHKQQELETFREKLELFESFTSNNFQLYASDSQFPFDFLFDIFNFSFFG